MILLLLLLLLYVGVVVMYEMMTSSDGKMNFPKTNGSAIPMVGDTITGRH
jgi:hypothetical protein